MTTHRLFQELRIRDPRSKKVRKRVAIWEARFRQAQSPEARYGAMRQLQRLLPEHPLAQMWENRDPRFNDMSWTFPE